jgi:hypothetical protein
MSDASKATTRRRVQERRRLAFSAGLGVMLATAAAAIALGVAGSGCIFDEGGYDGGGRRSTAPTSTETATPIDEPTSTTPTSTSTPAQDSGQQIPDTGTPD